MEKMENTSYNIESRPMAWASNDLSPTAVHLDEQGVAEIQKSLKQFKDAMTRENFPLPTIQEQLVRASLDVHEGRGFAIVRGLDPRKFSAEDNAIVFLGVASYIGEQRGVQDKKGSVLTHVTDSKVWTTPPSMRHGIHTTTGLAWHCDMGTDVLALHVRSLAETGGSTFVSPSWSIYKELAASYPEALKDLCDPNWPIQLGALDIFSKLASKHQHRLDTKQGDMVFINNLGLLHARDSYVDPKDGPGRHFVRLWLRNPSLAWNIPQSMRVPWEAAFGPDGNGFPGMQRSYAIMPTLEYKPPKYTAGSAAFMLEDSDDVNGGAAI
ncbi:hypothetical protein NEMBOFW57_005777 [Staphylotrichum longicolle]|uniref:TauD/TfdA-like domain-containing protein n=1 Tax=Staphylotrichum longicolle TaxID=669026 RepID=A0AAD4EXF5_9PEZI|nr:hypothetical protein NEMBOFW57_005777 [Staphylotrichum longicolle]